MWWTLAAASVGSITALMIAVVIYPRQKELDRKLKVDEEKRRAIADLILAVESYMAKVKGSTGVAIAEVPLVDKERIALQKSLSLVRAYGCKDVVDGAILYERSIRNFATKLKAEKAKRHTCSVDPNNPDRIVRSDEYKEARSRRSESYNEMMAERITFFDLLSKALGVDVSKETLFDGSEDEVPSS